MLFSVHLVVHILHNPVLFMLFKIIKFTKITRKLHMYLFVAHYEGFSSFELFQARAYNKQIRPAVLDHDSGVKWTNTSHKEEYFVGEEVLSC